MERSCSSIAASAILVSAYGKPKKIYFSFKEADIEKADSIFIIGFKTIPPLVHEKLCQLKRKGTRIVWIGQDIPREAAKASARCLSAVYSGSMPTSMLAFKYAERGRLFEDPTPLFRIAGVGAGLPEYKDAHKRLLKVLERGTEEELIEVIFELASNKFI